MSEFALPCASTKCFGPREHGYHAIAVVFLTWIKEAFPSLTVDDIKTYWGWHETGSAKVGWLMYMVKKAAKY